MMIKARKLFKDVSDLPTIPAVVSRVISLLDNHEAEPDEIADLILSDQVLAARVVRVVNSPLYRPTSEITSVKRALLYIGFRSVREMILTSYFIEGFREKAQPFDMRLFWMHSFTVGALSRMIATQVGYRDLEKAYLVGIIHDIGKVFLGHYLKDEYGEMLSSIAGTSYTTYEAELEFFGTTHSEVGLCLAQRWNFPSSYCDVISYHHASGLATEDPLLTAIITLSDYFCLSRTDADAVARADAAPGRSEENAWVMLKQLAEAPLPADLESFLSSLESRYESISREVNQIYATMIV